MIKTFIKGIACALPFITHGMKEDRRKKDAYVEIKEYPLAHNETRKHVTIEYTQNGKQLLFYTQTVDNTGIQLSCSYKILNPKSKTAGELHLAEGIEGTATSLIEIERLNNKTKKYSIYFNTLHNTRSPYTVLIRSLALSADYPFAYEKAVPLKIVQKKDTHLKMKGCLRTFKKNVFLTSFSSKFLALALVHYEKKEGGQRAQTQFHILSEPTKPSKRGTFTFNRHETTDLEEAISSGDWNYKEKLLALGTESGAIYIYDFLKNKIIHSFKSYLLRPSLAWHPLNNTLVVAGIKVPTLAHKVGGNQEVHYSLYFLDKILKESKKSLV